MEEYFHKGHNEKQKQLQNAMKYLFIDNGVKNIDYNLEKPEEYATHFEKMNDKIDGIDFQKEETENTFVTDESKKGFIFGLCFSLMNEAIEKGSSVKLVTNLTKNMIRDTLNSFEINFNEKEFHDFMNFNEQLSDHESGLVA